MADNTVQRAAKVVDGILGADPQISHEMRGDEPDKIARALAAAGLLAPAPLTETRSRGTLRGTVLHPYDGSDETEYVRYATGWLPVDRAEGDGMNRQNTVVLARDVAAAEAAGYPRHRWCVVTPRNIKIGPRGMRARYAVAVDLSDGELTEMLVHDSVAPAFLWAGDAEVLRVPAEGEGRAS